MKIDGKLTCEIETWDDPGDYPSGAGSGPLPSYQYVASVDGQLTVEFECGDFGDEEGGDKVLSEFLPDWLADNSGEIETDLPHGVRVKSWTVEKIEGLTAVLSVKDFDSGRVERDEPDC